MTKTSNSDSDSDSPKKRAPGGGRKSLYEEPMVAVNLKMTVPQREKLLKVLGGSAWVRNQVDAAEMPEAKSKPKRARAASSASK